jgi:16S rRNA (adenine1518-N6/adenine1519-N6)-dimethyltransferase
MTFTPRQTVSYLKRRFADVGLRPDRRHGQNFLVDMNLQQLLVDAAEIGPDDVVLEIGTGTGALVARVAPTAAAVVTVEIDSHLFQIAREELIDADNVTMLQQDALKNKNRFAPEVLDAVAFRLAEQPGRTLKLVANLPYSIATPVISNLLASEIVPARMVVTIQKELADRILARPSTKDYGALSIWVQSQCRVELVRVMSPKVFWPRPKVDSAILRIDLDPALRKRIPDLAFFHTFVRAMFFHRRKFLRSVLLSTTKHQLGKPAIDAVMARLGLGADSRAEQLDVETAIRLCEAIRLERQDIST